jgi:hypothetical protein
MAAAIRALGRTSSPPPRAPSPAFGSPLWRNAGLPEEEEYAAVRGRWRVDVDEDAESSVHRTAIRKSVRWPGAIGRSARFAKTLVK